MKSYNDFLGGKHHVALDVGFDPVWMPDFLFDWQRTLVGWAMRKGRAALFEDCGLGKTPQQLVWAENVVRHTNRPVLILTPLAVGAQTIREAAKFGIEAVRCHDGQTRPGARIVVTNYERLHHFQPDNFAGVVCDESSILKNYAGVTRQAITDFMAGHRYRLLCTATAAPNDYIEIGTSSEALGVKKRVEMLAEFYVHDGGDTSKWRIKRHAERLFWQWVCSWARCVRRPSDMGYPDGDFILPAKTIRNHIVTCDYPLDGFLFTVPAMTLTDQRAERRKTLAKRCEMVADLVSRTGKPAVCWCHLNAEGEMLEKLIPDAVQVKGSDSDDHKEDALASFASGDLRVLVTKPSIAGFGMNWQHCAHQTFFPSHSFEEWYQAVRRSWRFGQKNPVVIDVVSSEGESAVIDNLTRKADAAEAMFEAVVREMGIEIKREARQDAAQKMEVPSWLL